MKRGLVLVVCGVLGGWLLGLWTGHLWPLHRDHMGSVDSSEASTSEDEVVGEGGDLVQLDAKQIEEFGIEIDTAGPVTLQTSLQLPGRIVLNADKVAAIVPRVSGVVVELSKTQGQAVMADEVMAIIDSRELADATADYLSARERVTLVQATFDREARLWTEQVSSEQEYFDAKQTLAQAKIAEMTAQQKLHALGFSEEALAVLPRQAGGSFTRYEVRAPFAGTVLEKTITLGEPVTDTSQMFRIADLRTVWVELGAHEDRLRTIHAGQSIIIQALGTATQARETIGYISPMVSESTRRATVRVVLDNPGGAWRPGQFVTGIILSEGAHAPVAVPHNAIQTLGGEDVVFLETPHGFRPEPVERGREDSTYVEIRVGLKAGQRYVRANAFTLKAELSKRSFVDDDD